MRITNAFSGSIAYYDRSPTITGFAALQAAIGPHASTDRGTYTVPSNRKAFVESVIAATIRETAAGTAGRRSSDVYIANGVTQPFVALAESLGNTVADNITVNVAGAGTMLAGHVIHSEDGDLSVSGTADYRHGFKVVEYDA